MLLVDRGMRLNTGSTERITVAGRPGKPEFVGDRVVVGASGETWIVDSIRTWAVVRGGKGGATPLGTLYQKVVLFGGIETPLPVPGQPQCDCHDVMPIKTIPLHPGSDGFEGGDLKVDWRGPELLELQFRRLQWSAPGGVPLQFGVMVEERSGGRVPKADWHSAGAVLDGAHMLRVFSPEGKLLGPYVPNGGTPLPPDIGIPVQVWGRRAAVIRIRMLPAAVEVILESSGAFNAEKADPASFRFGPQGMSAVSTSRRVVEGRVQVVARFPAISSSAISACLTGRLLEGTPFEGCDLIRGQ